MAALARFVVRPSADGKRGDLVLGALFQGQAATRLRPDTVYEIREVQGGLTVVAVGPASAVDQAGSAAHTFWRQSVDSILETSAGRHLLTREEAAAPEPLAQALVVPSATMLTGDAIHARAMAVWSILVEVMGAPEGDRERFVRRAAGPLASWPVETRIGCTGDFGLDVQWRSPLEIPSIAIDPFDLDAARFAMGRQARARLEALLTRAPGFKPGLGGEPGAALGY